MINLVILTHKLASVTYDASISQQRPTSVHQRRQKASNGHEISCAFSAIILWFQILPTSVHFSSLVVSTLAII